MPNHNNQLVTIQLLKLGYFIIATLHYSQNDFNLITFILHLLLIIVMIFLFYLEQKQKTINIHYLFLLNNLLLYQLLFNNSLPTKIFASAVLFQICLEKKNLVFKNYMYVVYLLQILIKMIVDCIPELNEIQIILDSYIILFAIMVITFDYTTEKQGKKKSQLQITKNNIFEEAKVSSKIQIDSPIANKNLIQEYSSLNISNRYLQKQNSNLQYNNMIVPSIIEPLSSQQILHSTQQIVNNKILLPQVDVFSPFLKSILEKLPIGLVFFDLNEEVLYINAKVNKLLKCPPDQDVKKHLIDYRLKSMKILDNSYSCSKSGIERKMDRNLSKIINEQNSLNESQVHRLQNAFQSVSFMKPSVSFDCNQQENDASGFQQKFQELKFKMTKLVIQRSKFQKEDIQMLMIVDKSSKTQKIELQLAHKFKSLLLNSFSHELRTPLNCSQQLLEALQYELKDDRIIEEYIMPISSSNHLLLNQINDILDFGSFESDNFEYNYQYFNVMDQIEIILQIFKPGCQQKNQKIEVINESKQDLDYFYNDSRRITQIIINLINNSIKFTSSEGTIQIILRDEEHDIYSIELLRISVSDTGIGIDRQKQKLLTEQFMQKDFQISSVTCFMGLGLFISNRLAQGLVSVTVPNNLQIHTVTRGACLSFLIQNQTLKRSNSSPSKPNENSSVSMLMSRPQKAVAEINAIVKSASQGKFQNNCPFISQILIVDDVAFNVMALKMLLKRTKQQSEECYDGQQAINKIEQRFFSNVCSHLECKFFKLILMDIQMPIKDGIQATTEIFEFLKRQGHQNNTKIVICSAYDGRDQMEHLLELGVYEYIVKPVTMSKLNNILLECGL